MKGYLAKYLGSLLILTGCATSPSMTDLSTSDIAQEVSTMGLRNVTPIAKEAEKLLQQSTPCCTDLASVDYAELKADVTQVVTLNGSFPSYQFTAGKSFFAAFKLPKTNWPVNLEIQSIAAPDRVFAPSVLLLNSDYEVSREFGAEYFRYQPAGFLKGERLEATIEDIGDFQQEAYLIIYSPPARRAGSTTLVHPAKQHARTQNRVEPDIPDPVAQHSALGVITVFVSSGRAAGKTAQPSKIPKEQEIAPEIYANQKIEQAVAEGRIEDAMSLVEEAEANGSTTARKTFVDAVKDQQQQ